MDARTRRLFVVAIILVIALTGGAAILLGGPGGPVLPTTAPGSASAPGPTEPVPSPSSPGPAGAIPDSPLAGVIVAVDSRGLDDIRAFTLRTSDGALYDFDLSQMQATATFPLGHLAEHQATADPVLVSFTIEDGLLIATAVDDG